MAIQLASLYSRALLGVHATPVTVEVHISNGLPKFSLVGLPETAVKESKDRVRSALINSQLTFPPRHITVNLAPADSPKEGARYDLPIALGILFASQQLPIGNLNEYEFIGELSLSGELRSVSGVLPIALAAQKAKRILILPTANAEEASLINDLVIYPAEHLLDVYAHFSGKKTLTAYQRIDTFFINTSNADIADVVGQQQGRRALEIAAAGGHSLLMSGPPGTGKTMLASRLPGILPMMTEAEALEVAAIASITKKGFEPKKFLQRPFRNPHHTASSVALVGGGSPPRPGEISLAHHGVLFLDELPEFNRHVLEALREPLESGTIIISRAARQTEFPASFQLIAAMNPCPCGYLGDTQKTCRCTEDQIQRYKQRLSGPLMDRIDMYIEIARLPQTLFLQEQKQEETSAAVQQRVIQARNKQLARAGKPNAHLNAKEIKEFIVLETELTLWLQTALEKLNLSARSLHRLLRVARTIADLAESEAIEKTHLAEALHFRMRGN